MYLRSGCRRPARTVAPSIFTPTPNGSVRVHIQHSARRAVAQEQSTTATLDFSSVEPTADGDPNFRSPWPQQHSSTQADKPIMIYLPGIDGTGLAAFRQFPAVSQDYILSSFTVPTTDRSTFEELVQTCKTYVRRIAADTPPTRPIYLLGESFGGALALAVGIEAPEAVDRIVLVNPATSFLDSPWAEALPVIKNLPKEAYAGLPFALAPLLSNPVTMAANKAIGAASPLDAIQNVGQGMVDMLPGLGKLTEILPQDTLVWKLELLAQGCRFMDTRYHLVPQRVLVLAGSGDWLIPSEQEAEALPKLLPNCRARVLPMRSHALLQDADVNLATLLREEGFYVPRRQLSGNGNSMEKRMKGAGVFGKPLPVELPTQQEFKVDSAALDHLRSLVSPVFFSTTEDGAVEQGLHNLCLETGKPVLLIGNHQTCPIDLGPLVEGVYAGTGVLPRGLTHPTAVPIASSAAPKASPRARGNAISRALRTEAGSIGSGQPVPRRNGSAPVQGGDSGGSVSGAFLARWGAVPVGAKALVSLLKAGESVLLFPGGATEALKGTRTVDRYKLIWSPRPEFVRAAARFGACIVPFGAVGCEESVGAIMNSQNLFRVGQAWAGLRGQEMTEDQQQELRRMMERPARRGVNADKMFENELAVRFYVPRSIERFYFLFGRPIDVPRDLYDDRSSAEAVYTEVKAGVASCIDYLLEERERDPFRNAFKRGLHERFTGSQAPTFEPNPDKKLP